MKKVVSLCAAAIAALAIATQGLPNASAAACLFLVPTGNNFNNQCTDNTGGNGIAGVRVLRNTAGTVWTYAVDLRFGTSSSGTLITADGSTRTKSVTTGVGCVSCFDQVANNGPGANVSCTTLPAGQEKSAKFIRVLL